MILVSIFAVYCFLTGSIGYGCCNTWTAIVSWKTALAVKDDRLVDPFWRWSQVVNFGALCLILILENIGVAI